jgi:hypothetical protein
MMVGVEDGCCFGVDGVVAEDRGEDLRMQLRGKGEQAGRDVLL